MIREFKDGDLDHFDMNEYSSPEMVNDVVEQEEYFKYTLCKDGKPVAIIFFKEEDQEKNHWRAFFLISKNMRPSSARDLKFFMFQLVDKFRPAFLWTASLDCETINRWHDFLGMIRINDFVHSGKKYNIWSFINGN